MLLDILNIKISTKVGIIVLLLIATLAGWIMIYQYKKFMDMRFTPLEVIMQEQK